MSDIFYLGDENIYKIIIYEANDLVNMGVGGGATLIPRLPSTQCKIATYVQHMLQLLNKHCNFTCIYFCNDSYVYVIAWPELICSSIFLFSLIIRCSFSPTVFELNGIHVNDKQIQDQIFIILLI